ncbi:MAG: hypothetical protein ACPHID_04020 [Thermoplasmatota archaeon]
MSERKRANTPAPAAGGGKKSWKAYRVPIVIVLVWLAIVAYQVGAQRGVVGDPGSGCPGHWHYMLEVHIDEDELIFDPQVNRGFSDATRTGFHVHDATGRVHMHPGTERCIEFDETMEFFGLEVATGSLTVGSQYNYLTQGPIAGTYENNDTHELRLYHADWDYQNDARGTWNRITNINGFLDEQIGNGDAVLLTYVSKDAPDELIASQQDGVAAIGDSYVPAKKSIFVPIMAATMFAGIGLAVWNKFRVA